MSLGLWPEERLPWQWLWQLVVLIGGGYLLWRQPPLTIPSFTLNESGCGVRLDSGEAIEIAAGSMTAPGLILLKIEGERLPWWLWRRQYTKAEWSRLMRIVLGCRRD
ncbi:hypothetical protein [Ferrimonas aestuarii]|uniref:Toxin CptA n=1 Tax=Ferrimonas aestuarii TaxID=2569539 RepID=A0A4U1BN19_9GAMM|nr:hypothetical protein [Ferrimonas aestuarii]TKB55303.1 hypothetical protein FCL42_08880 [Ferrimonas aestuarii]